MMNQDQIAMHQAIKNHETLQGETPMTEPTQTDTEDILTKDNIWKHVQHLDAIESSLSIGYWSLNAKLQGPYEHTNDQLQDQITCGKIAEAQETLRKLRSQLKKIGYMDTDPTPNELH